MTMSETDTYVLKTIPEPHCYPALPSVDLSDETLNTRLLRVLERMQEEKLDALVVYADKEHGANFEYLAGFIPRFEEALLVLDHNGNALYIMGNENLKLVPHARLPGNVLHAPCFSLPNQPTTDNFDLAQLLRQTGLAQCRRIGVCGWKLLPFSVTTGRQGFDIPHFILEALQTALPNNVALLNATGVFIAPNGGARTRNNANELAHYEYGANLASGAALKALNAIALGKTEKAIASLLAAEGQPNNVVTIAATGERFEKARLYPSDKTLALGDKFSLTISYKGGLTSRAAYVVRNKDELPTRVSDYLESLAIPYYHAVVSWLETVRTGITGGELYQRIQQVLPQERFNWHLNPGHLVADEEWLCSPISENSPIALASGMLLQIDIIPSLPGYGGASIEDTVALADEALREELAREYPALWQRILSRRQYLAEVLNISLHADVLPMSNTVGYLRPFLLDKKKALVRSA